MNKTAHALAFAAAALLALPAAAEGHMCYSKKMPGVIIFTKAPCAPGMEAKESPDYPRGGYSPQVLAQCEAEAAAQFALKGNASATGAAAKDKYDKVQVGMSAACVRQLIGAPSSINASNHGYGASEQWVYETGKFLRSHYVYIRGGSVSSITLSR